jgi:hypothetical protein
MAKITSAGLAALVWWSQFQSVMSQDGGTVFSSVVYTRIGEKTPLMGPTSLRLTSYGAGQMYNLVRTSYLSIVGLSFGSLTTSTYFNFLTIDRVDIFDVDT